MSTKLSLCMVLALVGAATAGTRLSDADWLAATRHAEVTSVTDLAGDPGLSIEVEKTGTGSISILQVDLGDADWSANGDTFEVELENPTDTGYNINAFAQSGSDWAWRQHWAWLAPGQTRTYTVTIANPSVMKRVGFQLSADAGSYTVNIRGGVVDFIPSDPSPADGAELGVLLGGNRLAWVNHSQAYPDTGDDVVCNVYVGTDPNNLLTDPDTVLIEGVENSATVELTEGVSYWWTVRGFAPDGQGGVVEQEGPVWQFDAVTREPSTRYEAEDATIVPGTGDGTNTAPELRNDAEASGGQLIWTNWSGDNRGSFFWQVMAPAARTYEMTVHYRIDGTGERGEKIQINDDAPIGDIMYPGTEGAWGEQIVEIPLDEGVNTIRIVTSWGGISYDYFEINMDDLTATDPVPEDGAVVLVDGNTLSWTKHSLFDPENASDVLSSVYLGTSEPNLSEPHYGFQVLAEDIVESTIPVTLEWGRDYYWIVDSVVPVDANEVFYPGYVWTFTTVDPAPVITLAQSATVKRTVPVNLDPVVTDLGKPGLTYAWALAAGPDGVEIEDVCSDPAELNPEFAFDVLGSYELTLSVTDGSDNVSSETIEVTVIEYFRSLRYEAEDAEIVAGDTSPEIRADGNASANRVAWTNWSGADRGSIVFTVDAPEAGVYDMIIHYRVDGDGSRGEKIRINGAPENPPDTMFAPTGGAYEDYVFEDVTLVEGENSVEIDTSWGGVWVDYIEFPFIEAPRAAYDPMPEDWSTVPSNIVELSWRIDPNSVDAAIESTVYLGTTEPNALLPDYGVTKIIPDQPQSALLPTALAANTTYYWLVEYTDSSLGDEVFVSEVWRFSTLAPCEFFAMPGDLDFDCDVDLDDLGVLAAAWLAETDGLLLGDFVDVSANWQVCIDPVTGDPVPCP